MPRIKEEFLEEVTYKSRRKDKYELMVKRVFRSMCKDPRAKRELLIRELKLV